MMTRIPRLMVLFVPFVIFGASDVQAQALSGGVAPIANAGAAGARSPGAMVTAGFARREAARATPIRSFSTITTPETPGFFEGFQSTAALTLAAEFSVAIGLLVNAILERAGILNPSTPAASTPGGGAGTNPGNDTNAGNGADAGNGGGQTPGGRTPGGRTPGGRKSQR